RRASFMIQDDDGDDDDRRFLHRLGEVGAETDRAADDDRDLELLCEGRLPEDRLRLLERRAATDTVLARKLATFRPLDAGSRSRVAAAVLSQRRQARTVAGHTDIASATAPAAFVARKRRSLVSWAPALSAMGVAAALILWLANHRHPPSPGAVLPRYSLQV